MSFSSRRTLPARLAREQVARVYTWIAPVHDVLAYLVATRARRLALERARLRDGETVLEVAVGTGLSFRHLLRANRHGWSEGVDLTPAMLRRARRRAARTGAANYRLRRGDAYALDFADATFDLVLNSYMFDLLPEEDFPVVLGEFYRVLKPGGRLVLLNMTQGARRHHRAWEWLYRIYPPFLGGCRGVMSAPQLGQAGFCRVRRSYVAQLLYPSEVVYGERPLPAPS